jgi:hypothetical protein
MKKAILAASLMGLLGGCSSANPSLERHQQLVAALNEAADILATVTDDASAKEARPRLVAVGERIRELYRAQRVSKDTGMDLETLKYDKKYAKELDEATAARDRYGKEAARVSDVPGGVNLVRTMTGYIYPTKVR